MPAMVPTAQPRGFRAAFGLALILVGQPIAWFVRGQFFQSESPVFPAIPVLIGMALIFSRTIQRPIRLQVHPMIVASYALLWPLATAAMSLVDATRLITDWTYGLVVVAVIVGLSFVPREDLRGLPIAILLVGSVSCALPLYEFATGSVVENALRLALRGNANTIIIGMVGGLTMLTALLVILGSRERSLGLGLLVSVAFITGLSCVALSNTRSVVLAILYCLPLILFLLAPSVRAKGGRAPRRGPQPGMLLFLLLVGGAAVMAPVTARVVMGKETTEKFVETAIMRFEGSLAVFSTSRSSAVDRSSQGRIERITETFEGISLLGRGISAQVRANREDRDDSVYPHFTYLQATYDLGVIGGILFAILHLALPLWLILSRMKEGPLDWASASVILQYAYSHIDHLTHGTPYTWFTTMPIALLFVLLPRPPSTQKAPPRVLPQPARP